MNPTQSTHSTNSTSDNLSNSGQIEILLFSLGGQEVFGLNVFKIREVTEVFAVTKVPRQHGAMNGMVSLRGLVMPVVNLGEAIGMWNGEDPNNLIIAEFASRSVAFEVHSVDKIIRVPWSEVRPPQRYDAEHGFIFGVVMLANGQLVSLVDIESVCNHILPEKEEAAMQIVELPHEVKGPVFFVDDSLVARRKIGQVLEAMGIEHMHAVNGVEAEKALLRLAEQAESHGDHIRDHVALVLVDEEMPVMDGCTLTQRIKSDARFKSVPFVMYSALTSDENERRGLQAGVKMYVKKFDAAKLSETISRLLTEAVV